MLRPCEAPRLLRGLIFLGALLALTSSVHADPADSGHFVPFHPLSLAELYAKTIRFRDQEPSVSIGLMEGQESITLGAGTPLRLMFDEADLPKTLYQPAGRRVRFKVLQSRPAQVRYWVVAQTRKGPKEGGETQEEALARWRTRGYKAQGFDAGGIVGLRGNLLDTREWQLAVGGFDGEAEATELIKRLTNEGLRELFVREELIAPPEGTIGIYDDGGTLLAKAVGSAYAGTTQGGELQVDAVEHGRGFRSHGRQDRRYRGHLYVAIDRTGRLALINSVGAEALLAGLVPAEMFAQAPLEALKAQAVTARGEIFSKLAFRHFADPYHLCSEQHCQVYGGAGQGTPRTDQAVQETRGLLAVRPHRAGEKLTLVDSVYSANCGGISETNETVWGSAPSPSLRSRLDGLEGDPALAAFSQGIDATNVKSFLESVPPADCARSSLSTPERFRWKKKIAAADLDAMTASLGVGRVRDLEILGRGPGGRITGLRIKGAQGQAEVLRELPVRRLFGNLSSGLFILAIARDAKQQITSVTFTGGGWGHGVGMCQMGAIGRAERGEDFRRILAHYFGGAVVEEIY